MICRALLVVAWMLALGVPAARAVPEDAQVVLVVDTSVSMTQRGMDPERTSLLVSRLYADIVPGDFAVVRLLDLTRDSAVLPRRGTGVHSACDEDPTQRCERVEPVPAEGWGPGIRAARGAAREPYGVATRAGLADAPRFKRLLDAHLAPTANNSLFDLGFRAAQGIFDEGRTLGPRRQFLLWLSDGKAEAPNDFLSAATEVMGEGVTVEALVFGRGDTRLAERLGLTPRRTTSPPEIMSAFADIFRRIVRAPFRADGVVAETPTFTFKPHVSEAWVVVYGDTTLTGAYIDGPGGRVDCSDASDLVAAAGAYRVARITRPAPGDWSVHAVGGGARVAYAVIQRPGIRPVFVGPTSASAGAETPLVAALESELDAGRVTDPEMLAGVKVSIEVDGQNLPMFDDGSHGDATAADGQFTAAYAFPRRGSYPVVVSATSETLDGTARGKVEVAAGLRYSGGLVSVDLGKLRWGETRCVPLRFVADISAPTEVVARTRRALPAEHTLETRSPTGTVPAGTPFTLSDGLPLELCLVVGDMAPSSIVTAETLIDLGSGDAPDANVPIAVTWQVEGRPWWIRYQREIIGLLLLMAALFVAYGFIWPFRFERRVGLQVSATADLDQGGFYAFRQFRGTGARWYRHAIAHLHDNYRISGGGLRGPPAGAVARFRARGRTIRVEALRGHRIEWQGADGEWEPLGEGEKVATFGRVYRVASVGGLYFEVRRG